MNAARSPMGPKFPHALFIGELVDRAAELAAPRLFSPRPEPTGHLSGRGRLLIIALTLGAAAATQAQENMDWARTTKLGGSFSVYSFGESPYSRAAPALTLEERRRFSAGSNAFTEDITAADNLIQGNHNAQSCASCHFRNGRGLAHADLFGKTGYSVASPSAVPAFRHLAPAGQKVASLDGVIWRIGRTTVLSDGSKVELVAPVAIVDGREQQVDLRNAPGVYGLGLIEAIPDRAIRDFAQARPYAGLGISGRVACADSEGKVGRYGWKGTFSSLGDQVRHAMVAELGLRDQKPGAASFSQLETGLTDYMRLLAVPARRLGSPSEHDRGAEIFARIGCAMCHQPSWRTGDAVGIPERYRDQIIYPFSDFLLHDMGNGLSDHNENDLSRAWRTAPLWGLGVQASVSEDAGLLHDGRARNLLEAILWHGGEAQNTTRKFENLSTDERKLLLEFLLSL